MMIRKKHKEFLKQCIGFSAFSFIVFGIYLNFEPAVVGAVDDSITVTQAVTSDITISSPANVNLTGTIYGMTGGTGDGSTTWNVKTSDTSGFGMSLKANTANCLAKGGEHFNDYSVTTPHSYNWTAPAVSGFGFTVEPESTSDTVAAFLDNGSSTCGSGAVNGTSTCWSGFNGTTDISVISRSTQTDAGGEDELVRFKSQLITGNFLSEGNYVATITATAVVH
ncbi:MAG: hypothetical protein PHX30_05155 [Candidatus Pacebacteria bacterium]|nr:hypothetical protein [Candidatus Paceibacterota bacterium]